MTEQAIQQAHPETEISRRSMLKYGGALAGAAALLGGSRLATSAAGPALTPGPGSSPSSQAAEYASAETSFRLDVAMDGGTFVINRTAGSAPDAPFVRADTFFVKGRIFPGGTIDQGLAGPHQEGSIGTWICRGAFLLSLEEIAEGAVPHVLTTQFFLLDSASGLVTEGTEGGIYTLRAVTGGYGAYSGARGQVGERALEFNETLRDSGGGALVPAPNMAFEFDLNGD